MPFPTGCHDPRHATLQPYDALWLRTDTPTCPEHQQSVYTGGTAEAATAAAGTAGQHRYNTELMWSRQEPICILRNVEPFFNNKKQLLLSRTPWNIWADPAAIPFSNGNGHNNHGTARKHTSLQHPADAHDPHHTSHTGLRELWNCTTTSVCWKLCQSCTTLYCSRIVSRTHQACLHILSIVTCSRVLVN